MHVKSNVKKLVCAKHVAQSNSRSVNFYATACAPAHAGQKPPASRLAAFCFSGAALAWMARRSNCAALLKYAALLSRFSSFISSGKNMIKVGIVGGTGYTGV